LVAVGYDNIKFYKVGGSGSSQYFLPGATKHIDVLHPSRRLTLNSSGHKTRNVTLPSYVRTSHKGLWSIAKTHDLINTSGTLGSSNTLLMNATVVYERLDDGTMRPELHAEYHVQTEITKGATSKTIAFGSIGNLGSGEAGLTIMQAGVGEFILRSDDSTSHLFYNPASVTGMAYYLGTFDTDDETGFFGQMWNDDVPDHLELTSVDINSGTRAASIDVKPVNTNDNDNRTMMLSFTSNMVPIPVYDANIG